jgi:large subunit ribosomal protein L21
MYAVIASGGKQYRVSEGETLRVEKLVGPAGTKVTFGPLLFADDGGGIVVGKPTVSGVTVEAEIVEQGLGKKIVIFKYKRRKSYRRKTGHRQPFTSLKITAIQSTSGTLRGSPTPPAKDSAEQSSAPSTRSATEV